MSFVGKWWKMMTKGPPVTPSMLLAFSACWVAWIMSSIAWRLTTDDRWATDPRATDRWTNPGDLHPKGTKMLYAKFLNGKRAEHARFARCQHIWTRLQTVKMVEVADRKSSYPVIGWYLGLWPTYKRNKPKCQGLLSGIKLQTQNHPLTHYGVHTCLISQHSN